MAASSLIDNADIVMGQSPPGETCNTIGFGLPLLNGPTEYGPHHPSPLQYTTDARKRSKAGDILFCVRGSTTGRMNWSDRDYAIGRGVAAIRHKKKTELQPFVRAVIEYGLPGLLNQATGSTFPNVSADQLAGLWWPPLGDDEQLAIAHILGTLDDKIELNRRMNETLEAVARALFKSWFVDFDPVRAKAEGRDPGLPKHLADLFPDSFEDSDMGEIPRRWDDTKWGSIVTLEYGKSLAGYAKANAAFPVYGTNGRIGSNSEPLCNHPGIIIGRKGAYRGVHFSPTPFFVIDTAFYVKPKVAAELRWAYYELLRQDINSMDSGSAIPSTSRDDFYNLPVLLPPFEVQAAFTRSLNPCWSRQEANHAESRTLATLRDTLLPKLISGELRVKDAERFVEKKI